MTTNPFNLSKAMFVAVCFTVGCTGSGAMGCSGDGGPSASVDSSLIGIYDIDQYRGSPFDPQTGVPVPDSCDQLDDIPSLGAFLVIYSFVLNDNPDEARLGGAFCQNEDQCRTIAQTAEEPPIGYRFEQGSDATLWTGFAIASQGASADQCTADVQTHTMTSGDNTISINTDTQETVFAPMVEGENATCSVRDALTSLTPELPCKSRIVLDATRSADL
ncbi:MAG: hypothetical protein AAF500_07230 [Myxococcota bacterium]